ncbi:hypothetical protein GOBAR_AA31385 [Gossypium barbadense]|uniref:Uncharacterized protein n=1 Tax=Gossypium barbadense TaxID=3634 RepID=A0A2P5WDY3_GOSBA|nr:hypothetical protein GOBAR_AA31385 [Gossypium barbadense]
MGKKGRRRTTGNREAGSGARPVVKGDAVGLGQGWPGLWGVEVVGVRMVVENDWLGLEGRVRWRARVGPHGWACMASVQPVCV